MPASLNKAEGEVNTPYGIVSSGWEKSDKGYTLKIKVPASCTAEVILPNGAEMKVRESGKVLKQAEGITEEKALGKDLGLCLTSGEYIFTAEK